MTSGSPPLRARTAGTVVDAVLPAMTVASFPVQRPTAAGGTSSLSLRDYGSQHDGRSRDGMERVCENCARDDDDLVLVNRVYVVPENWDTAESTSTVPDAE